MAAVRLPQLRATSGPDSRRLLPSGVAQHPGALDAHEDELRRHQEQLLEALFLPLLLTPGPVQRPGGASSRFEVFFSCLFFFLYLFFNFLSLLSFQPEQLVYRRPDKTAAVELQDR